MIHKYSWSAVLVLVGLDIAGFWSAPVITGILLIIAGVSLALNK